MVVGIDITSLLVNSLGVGRYLRNLVVNLLAEDGGERYRFFPVPFERVRNHEGGVLASFNGSRVVKIAGSLCIWSAAGWSRLGFPPIERVTGEVDVLHASDLIPLPCRSRNVVSTIYDMTPELLPECHNPGLRRLHRLRNRSIAEKSRMVVAISECTKRDVVRILGIPPERVRVVYGGVSKRFRPSPPDVSAEAAARYGIREPYVLFVGTLEPRKNLCRLVRAFGRARRLLGDPPLGLVLVGRKSWRWEEVFAEVALQGLESHVHFVGFVPEEDMVPILSGARALVYPSLYEGFGFPPLEAMACGTPVVASSVSSIPEVVGDAALLVDPYDEEGLAEAIARVNSEESTRARLVEAGIARATEFPWERAARSMLEVYREVAEAA